MGYINRGVPFDDPPLLVPLIPLLLLGKQTPTFRRFLGIFDRYAHLIRVVLAFRSNGVLTCSQAVVFLILNHGRWANLQHSCVSNTTAVDLYVTNLL